MKKRFTLSKQQRLKSRKIIQRLFSDGKAFSDPPLRVWYLTGQDGAGMRAAFSVSSKKFKRAVDRNRIKRLLRESWRLQSVSLKEELIGTDKNLSLFILFTGNELPAFQDINERMAGVIARLKKEVFKQ